MRAFLRRVRGVSGERGSALISAVAIAVVGGLLISVVTTAVVVAAKDSGTDRARTSEVHTAEGAVDAAYSALEAGTPCRLPAAAGTDYDAGTSPRETKVHADIAYFDASGNLLTCASGAVTGGTPATAVITALSTTTGENAKRTLESKVNLTPLTSAGKGVAIFAASTVTPTNNFVLRSLDPDSEADLWVDSGDYSCSQNADVQGNVIVVNGKATLDTKGCHVGGDLWTKSTFTVNPSSQNHPYWVDGDVYVGGNAKLATNSRYGGDLNIAGTLTGSIIAAGTVRTGIGFAALPQFAPQGLPTVVYRPSDFAGFANTGDRAQAYRDWVAANATAHGALSANMKNPSKPMCTLEGGTGGNGVGTSPLVGPDVNTVLDLRSCTTATWGPNITLQLKADLVLYVANFTGTNSLTVESADGQPHRFWILSPDPDGLDNGTPTCGTSGSQRSGNITLAADSFFRQPISTFFYTPCKATISNQVEMYGQIYAKNVVLQNDLQVAYTPVGIPGVDLDSSTPAGSSGVRVDVVYKRETASM